MQAIYDVTSFTAPTGKADKKIPLIEMFGPTIQGEGMVIGQQTYFLRFGLCDFKCTMCDSMHAVDPDIVNKKARWLTQEVIFQLFREVYKSHSTPWVTFSGGNPCIHDLSYLCRLFRAAGLRLHTETQGSIWASWLHQMDGITISPKGPGMGERQDLYALDKFLEETDRTGAEVALKVVVFDQRDLDFARQLAHRYRSHPKFEGGINCYLSLGNPIPPDNQGQSEIDPAIHQQGLLKQYKILFEDIQQDPYLSSWRFLPQWHVFVWGNGQGH